MHWGYFSEICNGQLCFSGPSCWFYEQDGRGIITAAVPYLLFLFLITTEFNICNSDGIPSHGLQV